MNAIVITEDQSDIGPNNDISTIVLLQRFYLSKKDELF